MMDRMMIKLPQTSVVFNSGGHIFAVKMLQSVDLWFHKQNQNWLNKTGTNNH